jgi:hypothetical protein
VKRCLIILALLSASASATICSQIGSYTPSGNGSLSSNFTVNYGTWSVSNSTVIQSSTASPFFYSAYWSANTFPSTQCGGVEYASWDTVSNNHWGPGIYMQPGANSGYVLECATVSSSHCTKLALWRVTTSSLSNETTWCSSGCTHTVTLSITPGTEIALIGNGTGTLSVYLPSGQVTGTATDTTYESGYVGIFDGGAAITSTDGITFWEGGNGVAVVANPTFTSLTYSSVAISDATSGASIYYCQDVFDTCTPATLYSSPFTPAYNTLPYIRAQGTKSGEQSSAIVTGTITATPTFSTQPTVLYTSPSSIAVTFATSIPTSVKGECGTSSGGPYTSEVTPIVYTEGWEQSNFTGTTISWGALTGSSGAVFAITGLHQNTLYYCVIIAYDPSQTNSVQSSQFSGTTTTLSTTPVAVGAISKLTRLNDQYNAANNMAKVNFVTATSAVTTAAFLANETAKQGTTNATATVQVGLPIGSTSPLVLGPITGTPNSSNTWVGQTSGAVFAPSASPVGWWMHGDTETETFADDGNYYGLSHDCTGVGGLYNGKLCLFEWTPTHLSATELQAASGLFGTSGVKSTEVGWTGDTCDWEWINLQSIRSQIYLPIDRSNCGSYGGDANVIRSPDHLVHSLSAGNQFGQGLGPNSSLVSGTDIPVAPAVMPNNPIPGTINGTTNSGFIPYYGVIQTCQDESLNCTAQANNDGYIYNWCYAPVSNVPNQMLCRVRVEDVPLMDASKYQVYTGARSADDGIYDANWSSSPASGTVFGGNQLTANGGNMGDLENSQFIPDFNRFLYLNTVDNTYGGSVVLYDCGPYPWGVQTPIATVSWDNDQWPGFQSSFGQINPGSYIKTSSSPLGAIVQLTETSTITSIDSGTATVSGCSYDSDNCPNTSYSPFIAKLTLTSRQNLAPRPEASATGAANTYIASNLDLYYDFRGQTSLVSTSLPNLSTNDPTFAYSVGTSGFSPVTTGAGTFNAAYFSPKGIISFGFPPVGYPSSGPAHPQVITSPYSKSLTAFTLFLVFEHASSNTSTQSAETPLELGSGSTGITVFRNGTTANSWEVKVGSTTVGPFTLTTDGTCTTYNSNPAAVTCTPAYAALVVRWDGTNITAYGSPQIPRNGYTQPLTTLATGTYSGTITGQLFLGATNGTCCTDPFYGTMSNMLLYKTNLTDPQLVQNMNTLRYDMTSRGETLP